MVELVAAGVMVCPLLDGAEHVSVDLNVIVADGGVVECAKDVIENLIDGNARVLPSIKDARNGVLENGHGDLSTHAALVLAGPLIR